MITGIAVTMAIMLAGAGVYRWIKNKRDRKW